MNGRTVVASGDNFGTIWTEIFFAVPGAAIAEEKKLKKRKCVIFDDGRLRSLAS